MALSLPINTLFDHLDSPANGVRTGSLWPILTSVYASHLVETWGLRARGATIRSVGGEFTAALPSVRSEAARPRFVEKSEAYFRTDTSYLRGEASSFGVPSM
jgi:hypothetical protein